MKRFAYPIALACLAIAMMGCEKKVSLSFTNRLTNIELRDVTYDGLFLASSLLPGQTGYFDETCYNNDEGWPRKGQIEFRMTLNGKNVFVKTEDVIRLDCDESIEFEVNDSTRIEIF